MNHITVSGLVATEPRSFLTAEGVHITSFRLAAQDRHFSRNANSWVSGDTNWFTVTGFRALGSNAAESISKGDRVIVYGRLRLRTWGDNKMAVEIEAESFGHDLRWGTSVFSKRFYQLPEASDNLRTKHDVDEAETPEIHAKAA